MMKRLFDITLATLGLILTAPFLAVGALLIKLDSPGPVLFTQERIGRHLNPFRLYKLRTMIVELPTSDRLLTIGHDKRVTRVGRLLRRSKIDELPQLINVLKGDMSFVGPRPEVRTYVELYRTEFEELLSVRPGLTDLASVRFADEAAVLARAADPERTYIDVILPEKLRLARESIRRSSFCFDLYLIFKTPWSVLRPER